MLSVGAHLIEGFEARGSAGYLVCLRIQVSYPANAQVQPAFATKTGRESEKCAPKHRENIRRKKRGPLHQAQDGEEADAGEAAGTKGRASAADA